DLVVRDGAAKTVTARGGVEVRYGGRTLRADELFYEEGRSAITARGNVQVLNPDGTSEFADELVLDDQMRAGVAIGFSARLGQNIKLAGATAVRRSDQIQELNRAIYTPCEICAEDGSPRTPTWSIQAEKVVQDKGRQLVYYRNAVIKVFGAPVLYLPVFWHADPQAKRKSGFLAPRIGASDRRGLSYEQPYLLVISPYSDVTLSPQINTKVNPFLNLRARKRFYSGEIDARFGYTHEADFDGAANRFGDETSRSYVLARGAFRIDEKWRWGFTAERASEDLIFDKYEVGDVYETRGPYIADDRRLISQVYAVRQDERSYASGAVMSIQGLRPGDNERTFPTVAPLIEARWEPAGPVAGGRLRLSGGAAVLTREQSPLDAFPARTAGVDSRRVTAAADWRSSFTSSGGLRVEPFANVRLDGYSLGDLPSGVRTSSSSVSRGLAVAGADITWPFVRRLSDATVVLEPIAQIALSPSARRIIVGRTAAGAPIDLDEDSLAFEFDESNLFRANKFPGFDLYEDGVRLNAGARASVLWDDGRRASLLIGRSFRDEDSEVFSSRTGLQTKSSDWIVAGDAQPIQGLALFARARFDSDTLDVRRAEAGANLSSKYGYGYVRYLRDDRDINGAKRENLDLGGEVFLTKHWGVSVSGNRDLVQNAWVVRDLGIVYRDDCTRFEVIYRREDTVIGRLGPSDSVGIRLTLATLGGPIDAR
ncbi:MAG: LPS assembly protein LptD, partial [Phenylobacterium sp.]|uniref:LPS-assembly protein LptD n=1 Tax=Phenylobacterium sp. TaxID=1871053 RepID=UPI0027365903